MHSPTILSRCPFQHNGVAGGRAPRPHPPTCTHRFPAWPDRTQTSALCQPPSRHRPSCGRSALRARQDLHADRLVASRDPPEVDRGCLGFRGPPRLLLLLCGCRLPLLRVTCRRRRERQPYQQERQSNDECSSLLNRLQQDRFAPPLLPPSSPQHPVRSRLVRGSANWDGTGFPVCTWNASSTESPGARPTCSPWDRRGRARPPRQPGDGRGVVTSSLSPPRHGPDAPAASTWLPGAVLPDLVGQQGRCRKQLIRGGGVLKPSLAGGYQA